MRAAQGTSYYDMAKWTQQVADIVIKNPYVDSFIASVGGGGGGSAANNARLTMQLMPRADAAADGAADRPAAAAAAHCASRASALRQRCRRRCRSAAAWATELQPDDAGLNTDELYTWAPQLEQAITAGARSAGRLRPTWR